MDFPAPDGPITPITSPPMTSKLTSVSVGRPGSYANDTCSNATVSTRSSGRSARAGLLVRYRCSACPKRSMYGKYLAQVLIGSL